MWTENVIYSELPSRIMVYSNGNRARVEFPINVTELETEGGTQYLAEKVYFLETAYTDTLANRIEANYDEWLAKAKQTEVQPTTLSDVVEALNALQELVLGGEM